jgi:lysophospholipase L1-like esterase
MRTILMLALAAAAALAQPPQPPPPQPAVPQLAQANQLINDYGNLRMFAADNQKVPPPAPGEERVVFMGDSITIGWGRSGSSFFPGKPYINRGIGGQVTAQMLLRFYPDVVAHKPKAVVILAGTNDIGSNIGPVPNETIQNNLAAMADIAKANGIKVVMASVTPVCDCNPARAMTTGRPPERITALNRWIKEFAAKNGHVYLDYFSAMIDAKGLLRPELTGDGLHFNPAGYTVMEPLAAKAIAQALGK